MSKLFEKKKTVSDPTYEAYAVLRKPGSGGLYVLRRLTIQGDRVVDKADEAENIRAVCVGKMALELER